MVGSFVGSLVGKGVVQRGRGWVLLVLLLVLLVLVLLVLVLLVLLLLLLLLLVLVHSPPTPIWATEVGCPAPPLFGRLQGCFEFFFWLLSCF